MVQPARLPCDRAPMLIRCLVLWACCVVAGWMLGAILAPEEEE